MPKPANTEAAMPDVAALSFEAALAELDQIVQRLEGGRVALEDSIDLYARGVQLRRHCETKLKAAQERIDRIVIGPDGAVGTQPADIG